MITQYGQPSADNAEQQKTTLGQETYGAAGVPVSIDGGLQAELPAQYTMDPPGQADGAFDMGDLEGDAPAEAEQHDGRLSGAQEIITTDDAAAVSNGFVAEEVSSAAIDTLPVPQHSDSATHAASGGLPSHGARGVDVHEQDRASEQSMPCQN